MTPQLLRRLIASAALGFALALVVALQAATTPQVFPTNGGSSGPRTGLIVGQVVDANTGTPIPEAIVQLTMPKYRPGLPTTPQSHVRADSDGRYFFADLPAGDYALEASKEGFTGGGYGQRRASGESQLFSLAEGERRTDATLLLWKAGAIGGTVVDEVGEPVVGVAVAALSRDIVAGRARYGNRSSRPVRTDDRGMFRISGLEPGTYVVVVPTTETTLPVAVLDAHTQDPKPEYPQPVSTLSGFLGQVLGVDMFEWRAAAADPSVGQPRTRQVGDAALLTMTGVPMPPADTAAGHMEVYRTTYYPVALTANTATLVTLVGGDERTEVNISLRPAPAARLSGRLVKPDGTAPPPTLLELVGDSAKDVAAFGFETVNGMSDASGRFTFLGIPPGDYMLETVHGMLELTFAPAMSRSSPSLVQQRVSIGTSDIENLTVAVNPVPRVEGRVEFRSASGQSANSIGTAFSLAFERPFGEPAGLSIPIRNGTFSTAVAPGEYIVRPSETAVWFVDSITLDGRNVTDRATDFQTGTTSLVVTYTDKPSPVSGIVADAHGALSAAAEVLAFPTDPARWSGYGRTPRTVKSTRSTTTGAYAFSNLPPGEYFLIAVSGADADDWNDPKTLEALVPQATRLAVVAGSPRSLDLAMKVIR